MALRSECCITNPLLQVCTLPPLKLANSYIDLFYLFKFPMVTVF